MARFSDVLALGQLADMCGFTWSCIQEDRPLGL